MTLIVLTRTAASREISEALDIFRDSYSLEASRTVKAESGLSIKFGLVLSESSCFLTELLLLSNGPIFASCTFSLTRALTSSLSLIGLNRGWLELDPEPFASDLSDNWCGESLGMI